MVSGNAAKLPDRPPRPQVSPECGRGWPCGAPGIHRACDCRPMHALVGLCWVVKRVEVVWCVGVRRKCDAVVLRFGGRKRGAASVHGGASAEFRTISAIAIDDFMKLFVIVDMRNIIVLKCSLALCVREIGAKYRHSMRCHKKTYIEDNVGGGLH